jgi:hypothetical protein
MARLRLLGRPVAGFLEDNFRRAGGGAVPA